MPSGIDHRLKELETIVTGLSDAPVNIFLLGATLDSAQSLSEVFHQNYPHYCRIHACSLWELAAEWAMPSLQFQQLKLLNPLQQESVIANAWHKAKSELPARVVDSFQHHAHLISSLRTTIQELRMVGMESSDIDADTFPSPHKGLLLKTVLFHYEQILNQRAWADPARVLVLARDRLIAEGGMPGCKIIRPEKLIVQGLFQSILDQLPEEDVIILSAGKPHSKRQADRDTQRLAWIDQPSLAPPARNDGSLTMHRALSPEFEVRAVLGTLLRNEIPLDDAEVFYTDESIYPGLFLSLISSFSPATDKQVPIRFRGGIPLTWTRPGKMLHLWLQWIDSSFRRDELIDLLLQHLLILPQNQSSEHLLQLIRTVPVCSSKANWLRQIHLRSDQPGAEGLQQLFQHILEPVPEQIDAIDQAWVAVARAFQQTTCKGPWDEKATVYLQEMLTTFQQEPFRSIHDVFQRLSGWLQQATIPDEAGQPGCLLLTPIRLQESPERKRLFCIGLSEDQYPSIPRRDSLLTDRERRVLSPELQNQTTRELLHQQDASFIQSLRHFTGDVMFTYPCADQLDDRELFPCQFFLRIFRLQAELPEGDLHELESWLPAPLGPDSSVCHLTSTESWLDRFPEQPFTDALFRHDFPMLWRGAHAAGKRKSFQFTEFDGYVPEVGNEFDPQHANRVFSAHSLQRYLQCPLKFYFHDVLRLHVPEYPEIQAGQWLTPLLRGEILHEVFHQYHLKLLQESRKPNRQTDVTLLQQLLQSVLQEWKDNLPETSAHLRNMEIEQLHESLQFFLMGEVQLAEMYSPRYFETTFGMRYSSASSELDTEEPVILKLPSGKSISIQGRVDRIDAVIMEGTQHSNEYYVWDYKSGRIADFQGSAVRKSGHLIQPLLYVEMVEKSLRKNVDPTATVSGAGYFFPGHHGGQGDRIQWDAGELRKQANMIDTVLELMQAGVFLATDQQETCRLCNFQSSCAVGEVNKQAHQKQGYHQNQILTTLRVLRKST